MPVWPAKGCVVQERLRMHRVVPERDLAANCHDWEASFPEACFAPHDAGSSPVLVAILLDSSHLISM